MDLNALIGHLIGPSGGIFAGGMITGAFVIWRFIFPKVMESRIQAMQVTVDYHERRIGELEEELAPWREWQKKSVEKALNAKKAFEEGLDE